MTTEDEDFERIENAADITVYELAQRILDGRHVSDAGQREVHAWLQDMIVKLSNLHLRRDSLWPDANTDPKETARRLLDLRAQLLQIIGEP